MKTITPSTRKSTPNVSHTFLTNLKATGEIQRVPVGESLYLQISAKGKKTWYLRYDTLTPDGKRQLSQRLFCRMSLPQYVLHNVLLEV